MLILNEYNNGIDECWYDSSSIVYTKFIENPNDNFGQLYVTFKGGSTYHYKDVNMPLNYLQFKHGLKDNSSGKSLNEYIKPNYEYEKMENISLEELENKRIKIMEEKEKHKKENTFFISGHRDITNLEFEKYYMPVLSNFAATDCSFVVGDCEGADIMAQNYLINVLNVSPDRITVYIVEGESRYINGMITNIRGGYANDIEKDTAMTECSSQDIAFIRKGKEDSGTAQNILRRYLMA